MNYRQKKWQIKNAILYYLFSKHKCGHGIHSPFVYNLVRKVFMNKLNDKALQDVVSIRTYYLQNGNNIFCTDFGTGGNNSIKKHKTVKSITKSSSIKHAYGRLLYYLIKDKNFNTCLELGTSLGISTSYFALANPDMKIITMEGDAEIVKYSTTMFKNQDFKNIQTILGNIDNKLEHTVNYIEKIDFVFIDANHTYDALIKYYNQIAPKLSENSIVVIDDINWSEEMNEAWQIIIKNDAIRISIDVFQMGILFYDKKCSKEDFVIRF